MSLNMVARSSGRVPITAARSLVAERRILYEVSSSSEYLGNSHQNLLDTNTKGNSLISQVILVLVLVFSISHFFIIIVGSVVGIILDELNACLDDRLLVWRDLA